MNTPVIFVTGTDTGVGKSVLAVILTRHLRQRGRSVAALKPFCSGGRGDARSLQRVVGNTLSLNEINPWHYRPALAPGIAARAQSCRPGWRDAVRHIRTIAARHQIAVIEGAGGVLSPLTTDGDATNLIQALGAIPLVVCPNRLGAINQALMALQALPSAASKRAKLVLMSQARPDSSARSNFRYLRTRFGRDQVLELPWLGLEQRQGKAPLEGKARQVLDCMLVL